MSADILRRAYTALLLLLLAEGLPFVFLYRSEGAERYTRRYLYGVIAPVAAATVIALVLSFSRRRSVSGSASPSAPRRTPPAMAAAAAGALVLTTLYAWTVSDEYVSVFLFLLLPCIGLLVWERISRRVEPLMAGIPVLAAGLLLFAIELPGFLSSGPLLVWGDASTFATLFPKSAPFIGKGGRLRPNLNGLMRSAEEPGGARIVTNSAGFRNGEEFTADPPPDETRLLSLGDSFSTGCGLGQDAFFGSILERELNARPSPADGRPPHARVMNAEVSDPAYGLIYLQSAGMAWHPGTVLYGLSGNDIMQADQFYGKDRLFTLDASGRIIANPSFDPALESAWVRFKDFACPAAGEPGTERSPIAARLFSKIARFRLFAGLVSAAAARAAEAPVDMPGYAADFERADGRKRLVDGSANLAFSYKPGGAPVEEMYAAFFDLLTAMERTAREGGARFLLVVYPQRYQVQPRDWEVMRSKWHLAEEEFDLDLAGRRIGEFCAARGIEVCDLLVPFREAAKTRSLYLPMGDMHFNRAGHEVAAAAVLRCLERRGRS